MNTLTRALSGKNDETALKARAYKFFLCSLCIHAIILASYWQGNSFAYGVPRARYELNSNRSITSIKLLMAEEPPSHFSTPKVDLARSSRVLSVVTPSLQSTFQAAQNVPNAATSTPRETRDHLAGSEGRMGPPQSYLPAGRLTRLPTPLTNIDLNISDINGIAFAGTFDLILLINADGSVAGAHLSTDMKDAQAFTNSVVARFRNARFAPGEIDGQPVPSKLRITVVSELSSPEENQK